MAPNKETEVTVFIMLTMPIANPAIKLRQP